ncbi:MAG: hypothetical protein NZ550_06480 [Fimbriimonadales bacterium]|nr:hypothetical protein [Fimbriimonadales bacterium]MDW8052425.1 hypothetical protein [Armatimonadota bacterium]
MLANNPVDRLMVFLNAFSLLPIWQVGVFFHTPHDAQKAPDHSGRGRSDGR